jgi:Xaa-Pro aminopeptidase
MEFGNFEEFWKALGRLYDSTLKNTEDIRELREAAKQDREAARELREATTLLANAVQRDHDVIMAHEHRLDRTEITVEAILEDLRRHREGPSPR